MDEFRSTPVKKGCDPNHVIFTGDKLELAHIKGVNRNVQ